MAWDLAGAFQRSRAAENDWRGDPLAVGALQQLIQGDAGVPGASPMPGAAPPGGGGQPTGSPPQQGSPPPQPQQQQVNPLQAVLQRLQQTPSQGGGAGGQQPPPQPSQGPAPAPPTNAPIPGSQPMRPAPGLFQQPGQPPQQQQPQPQQQQPQQQGWGGQVQGPLDLRKVIQSVVKTAGPNADPHRIMAAVSKLAPLMNLDSQIQFRQMSEALRMSQQENQLRIAQLNAQSRENISTQRTDTQRDIAAGHDQTRVQIQQMHPDVDALLKFKEEHPNATASELASFYSGEVKGGYRRAETAAAGQQTRRDIAAGQQENVRRGQDLNREAKSEAEHGRMQRAILSSETRKELKNLSIDAQKEIEEARLADKLDARLLSANTRMQLQKLSADARSELFDKAEAGRNRRSESAIKGRSDVAAANRESKEIIASENRQAQASQFRERMDEAHERTKQGQERIDLAKTREQRLDRNAVVSQDQRHQMLEVQQKRLEQQILASGNRQALGQWRAIVDASHKRAMELIQMYSANQGLDPKVAKNLEKEQNDFYSKQIADMKTKMSVKPGTIEDGHIFQSGDPADPKNWKPIQSPVQSGSPGVSQPTMGE